MIRTMARSSKTRALDATAAAKSQRVLAAAGCLLLSDGRTLLSCNQATTAHSDGKTFKEDYNEAVEGIAEQDSGVD